MKNLKKFVKIFLCILLVAICLLSVIQKMFIIPIRNVFDEMYYSGYGQIMGGRYVCWGSYVTNCSYKNVNSIEQVNGFSNMHDEYMAEDFGRFKRSYLSDTLNKGESITINVYLDEDNKVIRYWFCLTDTRNEEEISEGSLFWNYIYYVDKKTMYMNGPILSYTESEERIQSTDEAQIAAFLQENGYGKTAEEYEHYFLYDKIIHDWTMGNLFRSKYATWWIGSVKFVDGPPPSEAV